MARASAAGQATQASQPGESGTYGHGHAGASGRTVRLVWCVQAEADYAALAERRQLVRAEYLRDLEEEARAGDRAKGLVGLDLPRHRRRAVGDAARHTPKQLHALHLAAALVPDGDDAAVADLHAHRVAGEALRLHRRRHRPLPQQRVAQLELTRRAIREALLPVEEVRRRLWECVIEVDHATIRWAPQVVTCSAECTVLSTEWMMIRDRVMLSHHHQKER